MSRPYYTLHSNYHISHAGYNTADLVYQTAAVVIDGDGDVLLVEDPVSRVIGLPRSYVPHCLDDLLREPLQFLKETGCVVDPLPLCTLKRRYKESPETQRDPRPELAFSEPLTTSPFAIALDAAFIASSNMAHIADGRQSIVWWYGGITHTQLADIPAGKRPFVHFVPIDEAVHLIDSQPPSDAVSVDALRLFKKIWSATQALPSYRKITKGPQPARVPSTWRRHPGDIPCYPAASMSDPLYMLKTSSTTDIVNNAFWATPDILVKTGAVLLDTKYHRVLLTEDPKSGTATFPRGTGDDTEIGSLLQHPLACANTACTRLALPRMTKVYSWVEGEQVPRVQSDMLMETTTDPFLVTLNTIWDRRGASRRQSQGRQVITFWYSGQFDASKPVGPGCIVVSVSEAQSRLKDTYAKAALTWILDLWDACKDDPGVASQSCQDSSQF